MNLIGTLIVGAAGIVIVAAATPALAESSDDERDGQDEGMIAAAAAVSLSQAIGTAESSTGGRAVRAGYESEDGTPVIQVDLAKDQSMLEAHIDPASGKVIATSGRDDGERDDDDDDDDGEEE